MNLDLGSLKLTDPMVLKAGGGVALFALGGSRTARMLGLALLGWAAWDYLQPKAAPPKVIPYDPDAPLPLQAAASSGGSADPFVGSRWEGSGYTPSVRPARPGEGAGAKILPFPPASNLSGGINPEPGDNVG
jgi:hypothetical protein